MKRLNYIASIAVVAFIFALLPLSFIVGQTEGESASDLKIVNQIREQKSIYVNNGQEITVIAHDGQKVRGRLKEVMDNSVVVDSTLIEFSEIDMVRVKAGGSTGTKVGGVVGIVVGLLSFGLGLLFALLGANANPGGGANGCAAAFGLVMLIILGIALAAMGFIFFLIGLITLLVGVTTGKGYRLGREWRLERRAR